MQGPLNCWRQEGGRTTIAIPGIPQEEETNRRNALKIALLTLVAVTGPACGSGGGKGGSKPGPQSPVTVNAVLRGSQTVPAVSPAGSGTAVLVVSADRLSIGVTLNVSGLTSAISGAFVRAGQAGINGPAIFTLSGGAFASPLIKTLTVADFTAAPGLGINTFAQAVDAIINGLTYVEVRTANNANGEVRGQLGGVLVSAVSFSGAQEAPTPVVSAGSGSATLQLNAAQDRIDLTLQVSGLTLSQVTAAHVHFGKTRAAPAGNVLFTLFAGPTGTFGSPLSLALTSGNFTASPGNGINTFEDAVNALLSGLLYINVHTTGNAAGEIRGQVGPVQFSAGLTGAQEVPSGTGSGTTGTGKVSFDASQTLVFVNLTFTSFTSAVQGAHIHSAAIGVNGPIIIDLTPLGLTSPMTGALPVTGGAADVESMLTLNAYFNIHTANFTNGEIRGQFVVP